MNPRDKMALEHGTFAVDNVSLHYVKAGAGPRRSSTPTRRRSRRCAAARPSRRLSRSQTDSVAEGSVANLPGRGRVRPWEYAREAVPG